MIVCDQSVSKAQYQKQQEKEEQEEQEEEEQEEKEQEIEAKDEEKDEKMEEEEQPSLSPTSTMEEEPKSTSIKHTSSVYGDAQEGHTIFIRIFLIISLIHREYPSGCDSEGSISFLPFVW